MVETSLRYRLATRASPLARLQADEAVTAIRRLLPGARFEILPCPTPGDRDKTTDLRESAPDFFTRDLHAAVRAGGADAAVHSAKDLEDPVPDDLDWFWLPDPADPRDAVVLRPGATLADLPDGAVAGVSSARREAWCRTHGPSLRCVPVRGTIEERLAQLDAGAFDLLLIAAAALERLGLAARIHRAIPLEELRPPAGQGYLALTFRAGDARFERIRRLFVRPVVFAGAGSGSAGNCTLATAEALAACEVCFHDRLLDPALLDRLPPGAEQVDVGKRCGDHAVAQAEIDRRLVDTARRGRRVVRLKGGDPGLFGRLAEELAALDARGLPCRVLPGVSSLVAATTGTGLLLTRRGASRGFAAMTPREQGGGIGPVDARARAALPIVFFMGMGVLDRIAADLAADGLAPETHAAAVFDAGAPDEAVVRGTLADLSDRVAAAQVAGAVRRNAPGLVLVGAPAAAPAFLHRGALDGRRVLLPCSEDLQAKAAAAVRDFGGVPLPLPLIRLVPAPDCAAVLRGLRSFDGLVITSPASVRCLMALLPRAGLDARALPRILAAGPGTAAVFRAHGIEPDALPVRDFGSAGVLEAAAGFAPAGARLLRLRSRRAGPALGEALARAGFAVTDTVLYDNEPLRPECIPSFDAVFFASASAAEAFFALRPPETLAGKLVAAMGGPTRAVLEPRGIALTCTAPEATVASAIAALAGAVVEQELQEKETQA